MGLNCCTLTGALGAEEWRQWGQHPARKDWDVIMDLGEGAFSEVVLARSKKDPNKYAALKVVFLESPQVVDDPDHLAIMKREADLLMMLDHPGIVECFDVIDDGHQMVIVMEWLRGGHLLDKLEEMAGQHYSEQQASILFTQLAEGLAYMHDRGVMHRDIKAENMVFRDSAAAAAAKKIPPQVKIIDLGMAAMYNPEKPVHGALGSPGFVAPEIVMDAPHAPSMDVFSLGVVLFIMLVGRKPYNIADSESLAYVYLELHTAPALRDKRWADLSKQAKDLLLRMLEYDPSKRITAKQVLAHEWVATRGGVVPRLLQPTVVRGAANVASVRRLRNLVHGVVALNRVVAPEDGGASPGSGGALATGGAPGSPGGSLHKPGEGSPLDRSVHARREFTRRRRAGGDAAARGRSGLENFAMRLNARALSRMHDAGTTFEPQRDLSTRYGPNGKPGFAGNFPSMNERGLATVGGSRLFYSVHGGSAFADAEPLDGTAGGRRRLSSLKPSSTAVNLSDMVPHDFSVHNASVSGGTVERTRSNATTSELLMSMGGSVRQLMRRSSAAVTDEDMETKSAGGGLMGKLSSVVGGIGGSWHGSRHNGESGSGSGSKRGQASALQSLLNGGGGHSAAVDASAPGRLAGGGLGGAQRSTRRVQRLQPLTDSPPSST
ncbi:hypothetical protein WJX81_000472 [Elliptochloris bilobata]|uniref:Protein kinase domain-containing protein n=1 Tax=Elliptochloris bilobata TaxID=381761 RepID=A0AAW1RDY6_9CHLO